MMELISIHHLIQRFMVQDKQL